MRIAFFWLLALVAGIGVAATNHWTSRGILCGAIVTLLGGLGLLFNWGGFFEKCPTDTEEPGSSPGSFFVVSLVGGIVIGFLIVLFVSLGHALYRGDSTLSLFRALWLKGTLYGAGAMVTGFLLNAIWFYGLQVFSNRIPRS